LLLRSREVGIAGRRLASRSPEEACHGKMPKGNTTVYRLIYALGGSRFRLRYYFGEGLESVVGAFETV